MDLVNCDVTFINEIGLKEIVSIEVLDELSDQFKVEAEELFERVNFEDSSDVSYHLDQREGIKKVLFYIKDQLVSFVGLSKTMSEEEYVGWFTVDPSYRHPQYYKFLFGSLSGLLDNKVQYLKIMNERGTNNFLEVAETLKFEKLYSVYMMKYRGEDSQPKSNGHIEEAGDDDLEMMTVIGMESFSTSYEEELEYNKSNLKNPNVKTFVYKDFGEVVGMGTTRVNQAKATIGDLAVLVSHRGQGIGKALLNHTVEFLLKKDKEISLSVKTDNEKALGIYKNAGFCQSKVNDFYRVKLGSFML